MIAYYGKKLLLLLGSLFLLSLLVFFIARLAPGDPLVSYYGDRVEKMSTEERWQAEERLGLNDPLPVQYARWLEGALQGDFGISYKYKTEVTEVIGSRAVNTLILGGTAFALVFAGALALGVFCVWHEGRLADRLICRIGTALSCIPEFWLSLLLILIFSVMLGWLPSSGAYTPGDGGLWDRLQHLVLPLLVVVLGHLWYYSYMIRNRLMEEVRLHEPLPALDGHEDGLFFYRRIVKECRDYLVRGGSLYLEIGWDQGSAVKTLMEEAGFHVAQWEDIQIGATIGVHTGPYPLGTGLLKRWKKGM